MPAWSGWGQRGRPVRAESCEGPWPPVQTQQLQRPREEQRGWRGGSRVSQGPVTPWRPRKSGFVRQRKGRVLGRGDMM